MSIKSKNWVIFPARQPVKSNVAYCVMGKIIDLKNTTVGVSYKLGKASMYAPRVKQEKLHVFDTKKPKVLNKPSVGCTAYVPVKAHIVKAKVVKLTPSGVVVDVLGMKMNYQNSSCIFMRKDKKSK